VVLAGRVDRQNQIRWVVLVFAAKFSSCQSRARTN
jgi:hypothetical protein